MGVPGQALRGLVGQSMSGARQQRVGYTREYGPGTPTFTAPYSGRWKFILRGPGGDFSGSDGGGSGAYVEKSVNLNAGQTAALVVGAARSGTSTSLTINGVLICTAGAASGNTGGTASGGDVNLDGSNGGTGGAAGGNGLGVGGGAGGSGSGANSGGAGAPGSAEFPGGAGQTYAQPRATGVTPGGGAASDGASVGGPGGDGRVTVFLERN